MVSFETKKKFFFFGPFKWKFREKASGTSAVTAVMYAGNAQLLKGLARDLLARRTLYQSCHLRCSYVGFFPSRSCRLAECLSFQQIYSKLIITQAY